MRELGYLNIFFIISFVCGISSSNLEKSETLRSDLKIIGGSDALRGEFPHQITLQKLNSSTGSYVHACGGVLLDSLHFLTQAHCIYQINVTKFQAIAGEHDLSVNETFEQVRKIDSVLWHPSYDIRTMEGDVGIVRVSAPFTLNQYVSPVQIPPLSYEPTEPELCTTSGWGNTLNNGSTSTPYILQKVILYIVSRVDCNIRYSGLGVYKSNICAGGSGLGACNGDSGSALICTDFKGEKIFAGTVSWGLALCATNNSPTVFTNIAYYSDWIQEVLR